MGFSFDNVTTWIKDIIELAETWNRTLLSNEVFWSCTVVYKDEMFVYGGHKHNGGDQYQIAKVKIAKNFERSATITN